MESTDDRARRAWNESQGRRWHKDQELLAVAKASSLANAQHFLAVLHQYKVRPYAVYYQPGNPPGCTFQLIAERGWMIDPPRGPHSPGILVTEAGHFYWFFHLRGADRYAKGVTHEKFYEACYHPDRPGFEVSPFLFSDVNSLGIASGLAAVYLEQLIKLLET